MVGDLALDGDDALALGLRGRPSRRARRRSRRGCPSAARLAQPPPLRGEGGGRLAVERLRALEVALGDRDRAELGGAARRLLLVAEPRGRARAPSATPPRAVARSPEPEGEVRRRGRAPARGAPARRRCRRSPRSNSRRPSDEVAADRPSRGAASTASPHLRLDLAASAAHASAASRFSCSRSSSASAASDVALDELPGRSRSGEREEVLRVPPPGRVLLAGGPQPLERVRPDRLEQHETGGSPSSTRAEEPVPGERRDVRRARPARRAPPAPRRARRRRRRRRGGASAGALVLGEQAP